MSLLKELLPSLFSSDVLLLCYYPVQDPVAKVISIQRKSKSKWRPVALDTVVIKCNHAIAQFVQFYMILFVQVAQIYIDSFSVAYI